MTDNTISSFATDDVGGVHYPRVKINHGADGVASDAATTNPLPTCDALRTDVIFAGSVSCAPVFALISASASSNITVIAAQTSAKLRVLSYYLNANSATSCTFNSSATALTGNFTLAANANIFGSFTPIGHFETTVGQPLKIVTGAGAVGGHLTYVAVSV